MPGDCGFVASVAGRLPADVRFVSKLTSSLAWGESQHDFSPLSGPWDFTRLTWSNVQTWEFEVTTHAHIKKS